MAITPTCDKCAKELDEFGAILLSPPNENNELRKFHLCQTGFEKLTGSFV